MDALQLEADIRYKLADRIHDQLATYVGNAHLNGHDYESASNLSTEELHRLFEEDDWSTDLGYEAEEAYEQDEGYIRAMREVLVLMGVETPPGRTEEA